jgi:CBS domain-containing protein
MKYAKDIMSTDVVYLTPDDSIIDAAKFFAELNIHGVAVLEDGKIVGILTVSDIIRFIDLNLKGPLKLPFPPSFSTAVIGIIAVAIENKKFKTQVEELKEMKVRDFMTPKPITVSRSTNIIKIARVMNEKNFHRLPVVSRGKLVGMVTASDLMEALVMEEEAEPKRKLKDKVIEGGKKLAKNPLKRKKKKK